MEGIIVSRLSPLPSQREMITCLNQGLLADARVSEWCCTQAQRAVQWVYACTWVEAWAHVVVLALSRVRFSEKGVGEQTHALVQTLMQQPHMNQFERLKVTLNVLYTTNTPLDCYYMSAICVFLIFGYCVPLIANECYQQRRVSTFQRLCQVDFGEFNSKPHLINAFGDERSFWTCHVSFDSVITMSTGGPVLLRAADMAQWVAQKTQQTKERISGDSGIYMELVKTYLSILEDDDALRVVYYDEEGHISLDTCV